ncbi:MAG: BatD family protein [Elusimicrobiota bacterium]
MKIILKILCALYLMNILIGSIFAENISISASVDKNSVPQNGQIVLKVTITGDVSNLPNPTLAGMDGFTAYSSGRSQNVSIVNGAVSSSLAYNYVLAPKAIGKYSIGPIKISYKGKDYQTELINIEVTQAEYQSTASAAKPHQQAVTQDGAGQTVRPSNEKDIFITTSIDKKNIFVDEQLILTFRFFTKVDLLSAPGYTPPDTSGFWSEDLPPQKTYLTDYNGARYKVTEIQTALFPTTHGAHTIGSAYLTCSIQDFGSRGDDFFANFFSRGKPVQLTSQPIKVNVMPLPSDNKPKTFNGTVGRYTMDVSVDNKNVETGDAINYIITIQGEGNIKSITEPVIEENAVFKRYDTITSLDISKAGYKVTGKKIFKVVLVPKVSGRLQLPNVTFTYFDTTARNYKTLSSKKELISVKQKNNETTETAKEMFVSDNIKIIGEDIRFIYESTKLRTRPAELYKKSYFWILVIFLPLIYFSLIVFNIYQIKIKSNAVWDRKRKALRCAVKKIKQAEKFIPSDEKRVVSLLSGALADYFSMKLNLDLSALSIRTITNVLEMRLDFDSGAKADIVNIWEKLDFMRFAPASVNKEEIAGVLKELKKNITVWDKKISG